MHCWLKQSDILFPVCVGFFFSLTADDHNISPVVDETKPRVMGDGIDRVFQGSQ